MKINFNPLIFNTPHYKPYKSIKNDANAPFKENSYSSYATNTIFQTNLISFKGDDNYFDVTKIPSMRCPVCEQIMLNTSQIQEFIKEVSNKKGDELIKAFEKYEDDRNFASSGEGGGKKSIFRPEQQKVVDTIKKLAKQYPTYNLKGLVNKKAVELNKNNGKPKRNYVYNFFINAANKNLPSELIASKIISPSTTSKEHIHPKAKEGANALSNYLCDCSNCNHERHELDFSIWQKQNPHMAQNLQKYLGDIKDAIELGYLDFKKYEQYIKDFIETIKIESQGKIILKEPNLDSSRQIIEAKFKQRKDKIASMQAKLKSQREHIKDLSIENATLKNDEEYRNIACYLRCYNANASNNKLLKETRKNLAQLEKDKEKSMRRKVKSRYLARLDSTSAEVRKLEKKQEKFHINLQTYYEMIEPERELLSLDENDKDYNSKLEKKTRLAKIYNTILNNEQTISQLKEAIQNNENILLKLKDYKNMNDDKFEYLASWFNWL